MSAESPVRTTALPQLIRTAVVWTAAVWSICTACAQEGAGVAPLPPLPVVAVPMSPAPAPAPAAVLGFTRSPILCQYLVKADFGDKLKSTWYSLFNAAEATYEDPTACETIKRSKKDRTLDGPGDIVVVVKDDDYTSALAAVGEQPLHLFLNGFDMGSDDGGLVSVVRKDKLAALRFHATSGKTGQAFWTSLYDHSGVLASAPLQAGVGWAKDPAFNAGIGLKGERLYVSVTSLGPLLAGTLFGAALILFFWWALRNSDTFRIAPLYPWWRDARMLRNQIHREVLPLRSSLIHRQPAGGSFQGREMEVVAALKRKYGDAVALPANPAEAAAAFAAFRDAGKSALGGAVPADNAKLTAAIIGLALYEGRWQPLRLPYSLARVQWGSWMTFATTAAVYLWLVYGAFPALAGSVLGLVAVSTLTAGASFMVDQSVGPSTGYSRNFIYDLMTGLNDVQQAHRYQAIVVNVLLFAVGIMYVFQHLAYPTFDPSWLALLGLSGLAQTAGKQILEKPAPAQVLAPAPAPGPAPGPDTQRAADAVIKAVSQMPAVASTGPLTAAVGTAPVTEPTATPASSDERCCMDRGEVR